MVANPVTSPKLFPKRRHRVWYAVTVTSLALLAGFAGILPVLRGHLQEYLGIGDKAFGFLFSIGPMAGLAGILLGGILVDRWGPRRVLRVCFAGVSCAFLILAAAGAHFALFALALAIIGLFIYPVPVAVNVYLAKLFPRQQRRMISLNLASSSLGGMMLPLVAEGMLYLERRYESITFGSALHTPFFVVALLLLGGSFIYRSSRGVLPHGVARSDSAVPWRWRDLRLSGPSLPLVFLLAFHGTADSCLAIWMARFLESKSFEAVLLAPGIVLSARAVAYLISRFTVAVLPDHVGRRLLLILPGLLGGMVMITAILSRNYWLTAGGYVLAAFLWSAEYPAFVSTLMRIEPKRFGRVMAMAGVLVSIALVLILNSMGFLVAQMGGQRMWMVMLLPATGFVLAGIGGLLWVVRHGNA